MNSILNDQVGSDIYEKVAEDTGIRMLGAIYKGRRTINLREDSHGKFQCYRIVICRSFRFRFCRILLRFCWRGILGRYL